MSLAAHLSDDKIADEGQKKPASPIGQGVKVRDFVLDRGALKSRVTDAAST
jgi:hypothetical protein